MDDLNTGTDGTAEQTAEDPSVADHADAPAAEQTPTFVSDEDLMQHIRGNPELNQIFAKMQGAYTRKTQGIAQVRNAAHIVDRFNTDPDFARQTITARAQQLGMTIGQPGQGSALSNGATKSMPPELLEAVKSNLSPELLWMAPALAASQWAGMQIGMQPLVEQQAQTVRSTRDQQYDALVGSLSEKAPGWEEHEEEMDGLLTFLQSSKMTDRRWGSKLELLHKMVTGDGQATAEAARRMGQAARSRGVAGQPTAAPAVNITEQIRKPKNQQEAWDIAAKHALAEMKRQGIQV